MSAIVNAAEIEKTLTPVGAPNASAICEGFVGPLRRECLNHMLVLNQTHLNLITRDHVDSVSLIPTTNGV